MKKKKKKKHNQQFSIQNVKITIFYLVVKRLMIIKNFDVKIQNLVANHELRPAKSNPAISQNKQTNRNVYIKIEFQNSIERLSFLYRITDMKIVWINP